MSETGDSIKSWLAEHPKMTGVLFTMMLLLQTAGTAAASNVNGTAGP